MAAPMNMEEWNRRMRQSKQADQQKKKEATDKLRQHHSLGVKEDDLKLAQMRKEDYAKRQESQALLHLYKKKEELEAKKRQERAQQSFPPLAERKEDDTLGSIASGSVQEISGKFNSPRYEEEHSSKELKDWSTKSDGIIPEEEDDGVADRENTTPSTPVPDRVAMYESSSTTTPAVSDLGSPPSVVASGMKSPVPSDGATDESVMVPVEARDVTTPSSSSEEKKVDDPLEPEATIVQGPSGPVVRLDVLFSFGLVTSAQEPNFKNYMRAVEKVIKGAAKEQPAMENVVYDGSFKPFVKSYDFDEDWQDKHRRKNVRRVVVIAAVPVFLGEDVTIAMARDAVVAALQTSIADGTFIALAQQSKNLKPIEGDGDGGGRAMSLSAAPTAV